jgi:multiple sugar transport system permease protein
VSSRIARGGYYTGMTALAILFLFPLVWASWASIKPTPGSGQPSGYGLGNFLKLARYGHGLPTYLGNSAFVAVMTVAGTLAVSTLAGYAFARFRFPGRDLLFLAILAILMVPYPTLLIPLYVLLGWLDLQNSLVGLALVLMMFQLPFATYIMRNSFEAVPRELDEAAMLDGASRFTLFWKVLLPLTIPAQATLGVFTFLGSWNDYWWPLISATRSDRFTLTVGLASSQMNYAQTSGLGFLMAQAVFASIPILIVYIVFQKQIVRAMAGAAVR